MSGDQAERPLLPIVLLVVVLSVVAVALDQYKNFAFPPEPAAAAEAEQSCTGNSPDQKDAYGNPKKVGEFCMPNVQNGNAKTDCKPDDALPAGTCEAQYVDPATGKTVDATGPTPPNQEPNITTVEATPIPGAALNADTNMLSPSPVSTLPVTYLPGSTLEQIPTDLNEMRNTAPALTAPPGQSYSAVYTEIPPDPSYNSVLFNPTSLTNLDQINFSQSTYDYTLAPNASGNYFSMFSTDFGNGPPSSDSFSAPATTPNVSDQPNMASPQVYSNDTFNTNNGQQSVEPNFPFDSGAISNFTQSLSNEIKNFFEKF